MCASLSLVISLARAYVWEPNTSLSLLYSIRRYNTTSTSMMQ
jgi:hypothetical protein